MSDLFSLRGQVALITGGSSGIGRATARAMGEAGASVVVSSENEAACRDTARELQDQGIQALAVPCDVRDRGGLAMLVAGTVRHFGGLDAVVHAAGVAPHFGPMAEATEDEWRLTMGVNLEAAWHLCTLARGHLFVRGGGSVTFISSIAGVRGNRSLGVYGVSKAGLTQLARNLAVEWGPHNIRVNSVSPGLIRTAFARDMLSQPDVMERRLALTPLRRVGEAHEVAGVAVMLASPAGAFITGQNLVVDGGTTVSDGTP
ncbi:short-chain dehydrogenase (plasmid) [Deinococcus aetherius]|uniref:Short-chain dehydrogenase n=1 Tax=Deinococcus aetherius TaxID=200252 RepID=A0ABN6RJQ7_9DEIO|nr:SDR family oxidoreductase [Deinococcus aetherius]BDP43580.1 short-chain dehydrogenase [Deinococcus aetherius]